MATHFLPLSKNVSCTSTTPRQTSVPNFMRIGEKTEEVVRDARFFPNFCHNMPLPWQHTFYHCQKMCLAHLHPKANICAKFHENWWKTEEVVRDARFFPHFCHNMPLPWQHTFYHCQKMCLAHLHPKANICAKFHENWWKNWGSSSRRKIFPIFAIICRYHGNTLSITVKKCVLHIYNPIANICAQISWELVKNFEEVVRDARFFPHFCHNMRYPWQHSFLSLSKNVSCTSTLQGKHLCQISWELVKNWGSSSRTQDWRPTARPPDQIGDRPPDRRHADSYIPPLYPPYTLRVCGGIIKQSGLPFVLTQQSIGKMCVENLVTCLFSLFWSTLMMLLKYNIFQGFIFTPYQRHWCRAMQLKFFLSGNIIKQCL